MLTFGQFKTGRARRIASACPNSADFRQLTNDADRELLKRGNFWNSVKRLEACVYSGCIVWPRRIETILALDRCGNSIPPKNHWASFNSVLPSDVRGWNSLGTWDGVCRSAFGLEDLNTVSVFAQPPCLNDRYVQFYPTRAEDVGKVVTIFGIDSNGQVIRSTHADGTYQDGLEMVLAIPYVQSTILVRRIDRVLKDLTEGTVHGYWFDGANRYDMAAYEPSETAPQYRSTRILGCFNNGTYCGPSKISALVKLKHVDVMVDDDELIIDDEDALSLAIQSLKLSDAYESANAEVMMARAVHTLNLHLRNIMPNDSIVTQVRYQGNAELERQGIGRLI